jgi:DNA-directed RNA polymerase subunit M/transcription elongation factor TFIIS
MLMPKKAGRKSLLVCQRCGRKMKLKVPTSYKISEKGKEVKKIAVIIDKKKKKKPVERVHESEGIEYYEELFEE